MKFTWLQRRHRVAPSNQAAESERLAQMRLYGERRNVERLGEERLLPLPASREPGPQSSNSA
jgi:hypothetical protein